MSRQPPAEVVAAARLAVVHWHVPASVQLAQWALESAWGTRLTGDHNCWGIKARLDAHGHPLEPCKSVLTHEAGHDGALPQLFRSYASEAESFDAHAKLLATGSAYAPFRAALPDVQAAIYQLGGGTAAHPRYATAPAKTYGDALWALISPAGNGFIHFDT